MEENVKEITKQLLSKNCRLKVKIQLVIEREELMARLKGKLKLQFSWKELIGYNRAR